MLASKRDASNSSTGGGADVFEKLYKTQQANKQNYQVANKAPVKSNITNVNSQSNLKLIDAFEKEFDEVIESSHNQDHQLFLIDIMEDLKFLDEHRISQLYDKIEMILKSFNLNLVIDTVDDKRENEIQNNLLSISLAIMNLQYRPEPNLPDLEESLFVSYMQKIRQSQSSKPEAQLVEQLVCIKNLVTRAEFNMTPKQVHQMFILFKNMSQARRDVKYNSQKEKRLEKATAREDAKLQSKPQISAFQPMRKPGVQQPRRNMRDRSDSGARPERSLSKGEATAQGQRMHQEAMAQRERKQKLQNQYTQQ